MKKRRKMPPAGTTVYVNGMFGCACVECRYVGPHGRDSRYCRVIGTYGGLWMSVRRRYVFLCEEDARNFAGK